MISGKCLNARLKKSHYEKIQVWESDSVKRILRLASRSRDQHHQEGETYETALSYYNNTETRIVISQV